MHEATERVSNGGIRRSGADRDQAAELRFRQISRTVVDRFTSWRQGHAE
jgi:hypothetical protein